MHVVIVGIEILLAVQ